MAKKTAHSTNGTAPAKISVKSTWNSLSDGVQTAAKIISALTIIGGAFAAGSGWIISQVNASTMSEIANLSEQMAEDSRKQQLATSRNALLILMNHDPNNKAAIEREAVHYFVELGGDSYMLSMYSDWCQKYGGNIEIVAGVK